MPSRKQREAEQASMILFPWVSVNWCRLEEEQKRQKERLAKLAPTAKSQTQSILKGICTLYGTTPGAFCPICKVTHAPHKKRGRELLLLTDEDEDTSGFQSREMRQDKADQEKKIKVLRKEMRVQAIRRMQHAAAALKHRRKTREKKMGVPFGTFRQDFSDTGGSCVTKEMNAAITTSFRNQNFSRKESRFKGRIKTTGNLLKFPKISQSNDKFDHVKEDERLTKLVRDEMRLQSKKRRAQTKQFTRDREAAAGRRSIRNKKSEKLAGNEEINHESKKRSWCWWRRSPNKYAGKD
jgi:hypothetical protein